MFFVLITVGMCLLYFFHRSIYFYIFDQILYFDIKIYFHMTNFASIGHFDLVYAFLHSLVHVWVRPICLPTPTHAHPGTVPSDGVLANKFGLFGRELELVETKIVSKDQCKTNYYPFDRFNTFTDHVCAERVSGIDGCDARDTGAPLIITENERWVTKLKGAVSVWKNVPHLKKVLSV